MSGPKSLLGLSFCCDRVVGNGFDRSRSRSGAGSRSGRSCSCRDARRDDQVRLPFPVLCSPVTNLTARPTRTKMIDDQRRPTPRYHGTVHGTMTIVREEGLGGIYRGLFPVVRRPFASSRLSGAPNNLHLPDDPSRSECRRALLDVLSAQGVSLLTSKARQSPLLTIRNI